MATTPLSSFRSPAVSPVVCSASSRSNHQKGGGSSNWWTPLFGWSSDPDYIVNPGSKNGDPVHPQKEDGVQRPTRSTKFGVGCFTEEKAKELRKKTSETSNFHDIMYHSAIASRLASDVYGRQGS
ncbi:OLC1v1014660C1 [Oldenlandia corymbosa var. corymbosa]|uniref:OLC1v1014660C1 n=1 Tax=Oldenlandia corymbosa var. corymbosa TaxID=529605 RepID=A0AAV1E1T0_OLDCO|nr:OLC1v1014660C1 [Oldenlandia corymbosa var. corymbosa]